MREGTGNAKEKNPKHLLPLPGVSAPHILLVTRVGGFFEGGIESRNFSLRSCALSYDCHQFPVAKMSCVPSGIWWVCLFVFVFFAEL